MNLSAYWRTAAFAVTLLAILSASVPVLASVQTYGTLLSYDFDTTAWAGASPEAVGTIDTLGSTQPSLGLRSASLIASGPMPISITETNLGKLTLAFSLSASSAKPVTVTIQSYDANKTRTGALQTLVYPAAPNFYQRYAIDLSACQPSGTGTFQPNAPYVSFSFSTQDPSWQGVTGPEIRVDNVNYALPAYYVSTSGSNSHTGRSEAQAFLTPQQALNAAQPGDIVDVMGGTYISPNGPSSTPSPNGADEGLSSVASFPRAGTPAKWIVLKNYPGQTPTFSSNAWNIVNIAAGSEGSLSSTVLAYLEVRGLHIRGEGDVVGTKYPDSVGQADSRSNSNGVAIDGRYMTTLPHHIRIAGNVVEYCPGAGIGELESDWITVENNVCSNNCWWMIYAGSGISLLGDSNFDATDNVYKQLVRNNVCYGNQTFQPWVALTPPAISDGNGIILDVNQKTSTHPTGSYIGRTLVQSNLCFNNGGSGIHSYHSYRIDIINNTACLNSASPALQYPEIFANSSNDVRIFNNILVAPVAAAGQPAEPVNASYTSTNVVFSHNLYYGGNIAPIMGSGDVIGSPQFVNPSIDPGVADFHLQATSPALATGIVQPFSPFLDLDGRIRNAAAPDKGAYELTTTGTALVSSANPAAFGASVLLTATVTGNSPTGIVTFTDGTNTLGTATLANGTAALSTAALSTGSHSLKAAYSGDPGNTPSVSGILTQTVTTTITGTVSLQAWQGTPQPLTFTLTPTGSTTGGVTTQTLTLASGATFTLSSVSSGTYSLGIKGSKWLRQSTPVDTTAGNATLPIPLTLPAGDINNDNTVSGVDAAMLRAAYGSSLGGPGWNPNADLNGDNQVSGTDAALLRANYGKTGTP